MDSSALAKILASHKDRAGALLPDCLERDPRAYLDSEMAVVA